MRSLLDNAGRVSALSRAESEARVRQLAFEVEKIKKQLDDPRLSARRDYDVWRTAAKRKLSELKSELFQREAWLAGFKAANDETDTLFQEAYELLQRLEVEINFEQDEERLMDRLDERMGGAKPPAAVHNG